MMQCNNKVKTGSESYGGNVGLERSLIAGVDEAGRGPLAGDVVAAAVILNPADPIVGLKDSKKLSTKQRDYYCACIKEKALAWSVGRANVEEIDRLNILQATLLAMKRAVETLSIIPQRVLIDGNQSPLLCYPVDTIIRGDQMVPEISAASIIAKVTRDADIMQLDQLYPHYGFAQHKGYGTQFHIAMIRRYGFTIHHRKTFKIK